MPLRRNLLDDLAAEVDILEIEAELAARAMDTDAGLLPPGARRALFPHEHDARVDFAAIDREVEEAAQRIFAGLLSRRTAFLRYFEAELRRQLEYGIATGVAWLQNVDGLGGLAGVPGALPLIREAEDAFRVELVQAARRGFLRQLVEAYAQGVPRVVGGDAEFAPDLLDRLAMDARRVAAAPLVDVVRTMREAAHRTPWAVGGEVFADQVLGAGSGASVRGLDTDFARVPSTQAFGRGRTAAADMLPVAQRTYASELLDSNTCGPCSFVDGKEYATEFEARADYPEATYLHCVAGPRCRGTLVRVWSTEQPATVR